jgi:putative methyltransferase (TIGR04325 family)
MSPTFKARLRDWIPPIVVRFVRNSARSGIRFQGGFADWDQAREASGGYDDSAILEKVKQATLRVKRGEAAYERDSIVFASIEYSWPLLAGLMWAAARDKGRISVLDFGGSLGSSYFQNREFLSALRNANWGVVEQPHYVSCGSKYIGNEQLRFFNTIEECASAIQPNVVLLSSVLQYLREYEPIVAAATRVKPTMIVVDRTMVSLEGRTGIYVQRVPASIYQASYPCRVLAEPALLGQFEQAGYELVSAFDSLPFAALEAISSKYKGYIFRRVETR